jgi:hypothetical protein
MIDKTELAKLTSRWAETVGDRRWKDAPDAKVVTGDYKLDLQLHNFEQDSGIVVKLDLDRPRTVTGYEVVDEKKWAWFMLRWS